MKYPDFNLYYIDMKYIRNLKNRLGIDGDHIPSVSPQEGKQCRPILGIVTINNTNYCIPLTSAKNKPKIKEMSNKIDFTKIEVNNTVVAAINFCDMIPVDSCNLNKIDLKIKRHDKQHTIKNKKELQAELDWCNSNKKVIYEKAITLYNKYISGEPFKRRKDCVNFPKAEKVCEKYNNKIKNKAKLDQLRNECLESLENTKNPKIFGSAGNMAKTEEKSETKENDKKSDIDTPEGSDITDN